MHPFHSCYAQLNSKAGLSCIRTTEELCNLLFGAAEREPSKFDKSIASVWPTATAFCHPFHLTPLGLEYCGQKHCSHFTEFNTRLETS